MKHKYHRTTHVIIGGKTYGFTEIRDLQEKDNYWKLTFNADAPEGEKFTLLKDGKNICNA